MRSRDELLKMARPEVVFVDCPEPVGRVGLRPLTGAEVSSIYDADKQGAAFVRCAVLLSICGENGERLFSLDDEDAFFALPDFAIRPLQAKALAINRLTKESDDAARKDSGAPTTNETGTSSPSN